MIQDWISKNHKELRFEIELFQWPKEISYEVHDIQVHFEFEGIHSSGRSVDLSENKAILKATAEAIERWVVRKFKLISSNGLAAHTEITAAQINARNELIERDSFLCHYLTNTPWFSSSELQLKNNSLFSLAQNENFQIQFGWKKSFFNQYVTIALARNVTQKNNSLTQGIYLGLASTDSLEISIDKSFSELSMTLGHALTHGKSEPMNLTEFKNYPQLGPIQHGQLALHRENQNIYLNSIRFQNEIPTSKLDPNQEFNYFEFKLPSIFRPFKVVQASNPSLQNLFFGQTEIEKLNLTRLEQFFGNEVENINMFPHPLA